MLSLTQTQLHRLGLIISLASSPLLAPLTGATTL